MESSGAGVVDDAGQQRASVVRIGVLGLLAGMSVAALGVLDPARQAASVLAIGASLPATLLFLSRPHVGLGAYLFVLPLVLPWPIAFGLNAGEVLTVGVIALGAFSLWQGLPRVGAAMRSLAPFLWPLAALAVVSVASLIVNGIANPEEVVSALFKVLAFGIVAVLVHIHSDTPEKATLILRASLGSALAVAAYAVVAYVLGWSDSEVYGNRASGTFEHWNALGGYMALMSMPTLAMAIASRRPVGRLAFGGAFALQIAALTMSLTLGSILALVLAAVISAVMVFRVGWRRLMIAGGLCLMVGVAVFALNEPLRDKVLAVDERVLDRLGTYAVGVSMFRDRFWLGFGSEQRLLDELLFGAADYGLTIFGPSSSVPHNAFLRMGVEKGVFGVAMFTLVIVGVLRVLFRERRARQLRPGGLLYVGLVVGVIAFLVQNLTNDLIFHARLGIVFFALIALSDQLRRQGSAAAPRAPDGS